MTPLLQLAVQSGCSFIQGRQMMLGQISKMTDYFGIPATAL
jgi:shikimate dehydrogenase